MPCISGARWVQKRLLTENPSARLRVYVVWLPMLAKDARQTCDRAALPDARALHYWDGRREVAKWFARNVEGRDGVAWDVYYLHGPEAVWGAVPSPLAGSGGTVFAERLSLERQARKVLPR
jgi:hypothetical protein